MPVIQLKKYNKPVFALLFSLFILLTSEKVWSQDWNLKLDASIGGYQLSGQDHPDNGNFMMRFSGKLNFRQKVKKDILKLQFSFKPDIYRGSSELNILSFLFRGGYEKKIRNIHIQPNVYLIRRIYNSTDNQNAYDQSDLSLKINYILLPKINLLAQAGYIHAEIDSKTPFQITLTNISFYAVYYVNSRLRFRGGIYSEKYENDYTSFVGFLVETTYRESKLGPEIALIYSGKLIVNISYKLLDVDPNSPHGLEIDNYTEHGINTVIARKISKKMTALLFAAYYNKNISLDQNQVALYSPVNAENNVRFQLSYDLSPRLSVRFNAGYSKNRLIEDQNKISGYQASVGIEFNK